MHEIEKTLNYARNEGLNCSQAILTAFGESLGMDPKTAKTLGRPWGGGMGHLAETCGYLTGAVLVLALAYDQKDETRSRQEVFEAVRQLFDRFSRRRGATRCKDLLGADLSTEEGLRRIKEEGLVSKICHGEDGIGRDVAEILSALVEGRKERFRREHK
jgi:C_GCAxxG_C_C family probable redox protein